MDLSCYYKIWGERKEKRERGERRREVVNRECGAGKRVEWDVSLCP